MTFASEFDERVVNDNLSRAASEVEEIIMNFVKK